MTTDLFKELDSRYSKFCSFAMWGDDLNDTKVIDDNIPILHGSCIFIGLNASAELRRFKNFHMRHPGGKDSWLQETLGNHHDFKGSYMTDIFKNDFSSKQSDVDKSLENTKKNIELLKEEIGLLAEYDPKIIAFGNDTFNLLAKHGFSPLKKLPHYSGRITKADFINAVKNLTF